MCPGRVSGTVPGHRGYRGCVLLPLSYARKPGHIHSDEGKSADARQTVAMRTGGFLTRGQRRLAWVGFGALAAEAPAIAAWARDDSWLLSVTVAGLVAVVIIADDAERRRGAAVESDPDPEIPRERDPNR